MVKSKCVLGSSVCELSHPGGEAQGEGSLKGIFNAMNLGLLGLSLKSAESKLPWGIIVLNLLRNVPKEITSWGKKCIFSQLDIFI